MIENENLHKKINDLLRHGEELPYWAVMIYELVVGAGYSYSRIAHRMGVSPSTIQKLASNHDRKPRHIIFHRLLVLYYKVFYGPCPSPQAQAYVKQKELTEQKKDLLKLMEASVEESETSTHNKH